MFSPPGAPTRTAVRRISLSIAVAAFFIMAIVGCLSGVEPFTCALRALAGAVVLYVLAKMAGRIVLRMMADAIMSGSSRDKGSRNDTHERQ